MFLDRAAELAFLRDVLTRRHPGPGQFIMLYGRRRVGKSTLLQHWIEQSGLPFTYWAAEKEPAPLQRRKFFAQLLREDPDLPEHADVYLLVVVVARRGHDPRRQASYCGD